uniref:Uncharacterized protein n=1 Tax=Strongyloides papillosus TaxID=174720 RepID=A0A0N5BVE7_STREA
MKKKLKNNEFPVKSVLEKSNDTEIFSAITAISPIQTKLGVNRSIIKEQICLHHINRPEDLTPLNITSYQCAAKVFSVDEIFTFLIKESK